jgi:hypothetical protein
MKLLKQVFIVFFMFTGAFLHAQKKAPVDVLYLKDGNKLFGKISFYEKRKETVIFLESGMETPIADSLIAKIIIGINPAQIPIVERNIAKNLARPISKGLFIHPEFYLAFGKQNGEPLASSGISAHFGYQFNPKWSADLRFGINGYSPAERILPLSAGVQRIFAVNNSRYAFLMGVETGYGIALNNELNNISAARGGWLIHPYWGLRKTKVSKKNAHFSIGYRFQEMHYKRYFSEDNFEIYDLMFKRLTLKYGLTFWLKKD